MSSSEQPPADAPAAPTSSSTEPSAGPDAPPSSSSPSTKPPKPYRQHAFVPLEANPALMTSMLHALGVSSALAMHDVYSLTDPALLAFIPRPALALLLVFPVSAAYESHRLAEDSLLHDYAGKGAGEKVLWFKQTIQNACGTMGLLHAVGNGAARGFVEPSTPLHSLLAAATPLPPAQRSALLENSEALAKAHHDVATQGDTQAPGARDDVELHYVCFVKNDDGTLYELDGSRKGPLPRGQLEPDEDVLSEKALLWGPLKFLEREGADMRFSCVALAGSLE